MYKLENDVQWTDELKSAFKHNVTRAKILYNNVEINENNHLKDLTLDEQYYISNLGFVGAATAKKVEINLLETDEDLNLENQEIEVKIGADYNGNTYYINYGKFIVNKPPENDETSGTIRVVAYDYMIKFNKPYIDRVIYPCSLLTLLQDICNQAGVILGNTNFANKDFIVENNQFEGNTLREVLQQIAKCAFSWARIGQDNKLYLDFNVVPETTETITINDYKVNAFKKANEYYGPVNQVTYADSYIEGQEERVKDQKSIDEYGLKELVIYDNLFAYTAEKRSTLIQAGTKLFGLTYMPISELELIGLAYLDCRDAIAVETLAEETFTSRVFSHQIRYNGTLHDSIVTEGSSDNEETYKNTATTVFQNQQTQIKVDKANKTIQLLAGEVTEQNNKIAQLEITTDQIETQVSNMYSPTRTLTGTKQIVLEKCIKGYLVKLRIIGNNNVFSRLYPADDLYPSDTLYPRGDSRIIVTDENGNSMMYELRVNEVLRANEEVYDEYILEDNYAKVIRRVNADGTTKEQEVEEIIGTYTIYLEDGTNTIRIQNYSANMEAVYVEQNAYTDQFVTEIEMESSITQTAEEITSQVSREMAGDKIVSRINQTAEAVSIDANKINLNGAITANGNFKINLDGTMECTNADVQGKITADEGLIAGFELGNHRFSKATEDYTVELLDGTNEANGLFLIVMKKVNGNWTTPFYVTSDGYLSATNAKITGEIYLDPGTVSHPNFKVGSYTWLRDGQFHMGNSTSYVDFTGGVVDDIVTDPGVSVSRGGTNSVINYWGISTPQVNCGDLYVSGSKNRVVDIDDGKRVLLNAYETATPYFGDIGSDKTNENGICKINIEEIFSQTIEFKDYKVFIQKCGEGDLYVKKYDKYFEVIGTPNLDFDWELKAVQKGFLNTRLEEYKGGKING